MKTYSYTNEAGYTHRIIIIRETAKSVFYKYASQLNSKIEMRMSKNSFKIFKEDK